MWFLSTNSFIQFSPFNCHLATIFVRVLRHDINNRKGFTVYKKKKNTKEIFSTPIDFIVRSDIRIHMHAHECGCEPGEIIV